MSRSRTTHRVWRRVVPALVVVLLAAQGCASTVTGTPDARPPLGPVPDALAGYYSQQVAWGPCGDFATSPDDQLTFADPTLECTRVAVPLDYADPGGARASVALLRRQASGERTGVLFVNPGGPGASGISFAASEASELGDTEVGKHFDLVGFDPRGIGASQPAISCLTGPEADGQRAVARVDETPAGIAAAEGDEKDFAGKCAQRTGDAVLSHVGTRENARDLDILRGVLGEAKLTYLGYSYGTRLGTEYAEAFPGNVRAMVLDGAVDPTADPVDDLVRQGAGFQQAFTAFATQCAASPTCPLGTDPAAANARYRALVEPLLAKSAATQDPRGLSYEDANTGVLQALYSQQLLPALTRGLTELSQGKGDGLLRLADLYNDRDDDGGYTNQSDAFTAIRCVDDPPVTDRAETGQADARYRQAAPFLDDGRGTGNAPLDVCAFWPVPSTGAPGAVSVPGLPKVLVVSTTGDPATPYQAGVDLASQLNAALLTYEGTQHTVSLQGVGCVDDIVTRYLVDTTTPPDGARC